MSLMQSDQSSTKFGFPKLSGSAGYSNWTLPMRQYFKSKGLWDIVRGDDERPSVLAAGTTPETIAAAAARREEMREWDKNDAAAFLAITSAVTATQMIHIKSKETAHEAWEALKKVHQKNGQAALYTLLERLVNTRYKDGDDLEEHIAYMVNTATDLAQIDEPVKDDHLVVYLLMSLPSSWQNVRIMIDAATMNSESKPTSEEEIAKVLAEYERRKLDNPSSSSSTKRSNLGALQAKTDVSQVVCHNCGKKGHYKNKCRAPKKEDAKKGAVVEEVFSLLALSDTEALKTSSVSQEQWAVDSGAGRNFSGRRDELDNFQPGRLRVEVANGVFVECPGYGLKSLTLDTGVRLDLSRVWYLLGATTGLLSVKALGAKGCHTIFKDDVATVWKGDKKVFSTVPGTPYLVPLAPEPAKLATESTLAGSTRDSGAVSLMEAHQNLGHPGLNSILEMEQSGCCEGFKLLDRIKKECEDCLLEKSRRSPFKTLSTPAPRPFYRLFVDLGFVEHPDVDGNQIYFAIVDQYSTAKWTFALPRKDARSVCDVWKRFLKNVENLYGAKVAIVRSDNGSEFISKAFVAILEESGITHERTAPYTPEQNGQVERMNGSAMTRVRTILKAAKVEKEWWSHALSYVTFVSNRMPHPRIPGKTPYEILYGKKPSVKHLKPFGATAFVHVDKALRSKLDDTAVKGFLVGYDTDYNYKVYVEELGRVVVSRHVAFTRMSAEVFPPEDLPAKESPAVAPKEVQVPPPKPVAAPPVGDGYEYRPYLTGRNPGRYEEIDESNIIEGSRRRTTAAFGGVSREHDSPVFVMLTKVLDEDDKMATADETREESDLLVGVAMPEVPKSYAEAMAHKDRDHWRDAVDTEWEAFDQHGVLKLSKLPPGCRALGTTWVFATKTDNHGRILRYKARLVAQGFAQRPGIDFNETFAPVARMSTIRALFALAASEGLKIESFDFDTAFFNGKMTEDVYIKIPPGYPGKSAPGDVLKLVGAMYGTKQAPREWYAAVDTLMTKRGFEKAKSDACLYTKTVDGRRVIVVLYVDDGLILADSQETIDLELDLLNKVYKLKRLGHVSTFLSIQVVFTDEGIVLHQKKYIDSIIARYLSDGSIRS